MLKKIGITIALLIVITVIVNIILGIAGTFLPIEFVKPSEVIEAPQMYHFIIGNFDLKVNQTVMNTWVIMAMIIFIIKLGTKNISVTNMSKWQLILEEYYKLVENLFLSNFGSMKKKYWPLFGAMFAFLLFSNLSLFLFPFIITITKNQNGIYEVKHFFRTPTADLNTTIGLALVVLVVTIYASVNKFGWKHYLKSYLEPMWFMLPMNIIEKFSNVLNTSMRLFGNMLSGLVIAGLLYSLTSKFLIPEITNQVLTGPFSFSVGWPMVLQLYLDLFVGIIQAFVFTILSSVYVAGSLQE